MSERFASDDGYSIYVTDAVGAALKVSVRNRLKRNYT